MKQIEESKQKENEWRIESVSELEESTENNHSKRRIEGIVVGTADENERDSGRSSTENQWRRKFEAAMRNEAEKEDRKEKVETAGPKAMDGYGFSAKTYA